MKITNVLGLFDGMSCGQIALNRAEVPYENYYASEIDKPAIQIAMKNYPHTIQLGDVCKASSHNLPVIDLLIGGSPCQGFSFAGRQLNFNDPRSRLFFEYWRLLRELREKNPDIKYLLENVKMSKQSEDVITEMLGVKPIQINSALVSGQNRVRLYWTNIEGVQQPEDQGILLVDALGGET
jgi:site-specific DNA-cytosine methylase